MSILIKGGTLVSATQAAPADVLIDGATISGLGDDLGQDADEIIDARGKFVLPGLIDPHVHLERGSGPDLVTCDDFSSGTTAAAFGGTTTVIHFCVQHDSETLSQTLDRERERLDAQPPAVDVGFHVIVRDLAYRDALADLASLVSKGVPSYKLFMAFKGIDMVDDATLFRAMRTAAEAEALVMVHAENGDVIDLLVREAVDRGEREPRWHATTRPALLEAEATSRAIYLARLATAPLYIVHVSCEQAVDPIRRARENGWDVWGETCPQYLFSDASALDRPHFEGAKYVFTPPPRTKKDQEHLWAALESDVLSVVATDHGPFRWSDQKSRGRSDFSLIPNGAPGIEHRLQVLYTLGVEAQRFSITRLAQVLAETPARLFGLYPRKGTIQVGSDADLLVLDPTRRTQITASGQHSAVDYSLYEGLSTIDGPELVTVRGNIVVRGGTLASDKSGEFVQRAPFGSELRSAPESAWAVRQSGSTSDER